MLLPFSRWHRRWPLVLLGLGLAGLLGLLGAYGLMIYLLRNGSENGPAARQLETELAMPQTGSPSSKAASFDQARLRGVSWVAGDSITAADLEPLLRAHVSWITQMPFGWQASTTTPRIRLSAKRRPARGGWWGESDAGLIYTARLVRRHGIRTLLKPHLWVRGRGAWPGAIRMNTDADWDAWFASYGRFILHYARLAEAGHMDGLCIGTELAQATGPGHERAWRSLIRQIRAVYHGQLTYAAHWSGEYQQIGFWDALDYAGIQAYFPLSATNRPSLADLARGWQPHLRALAAWQKKIKKPVVFTEIGYKATPDAAARPWEWPASPATPAAPDQATQARCYEAMFRACWGQPWLRGLFIWKWYPGLAADGPAGLHADFTPQHKPAEAVLRRWYGQ